jgi:2,5-diamino-6-(ribosylamino)-4(3H)-pyrimidinone 5'-phosphate reductase
MAETLTPSKKPTLTFPSESRSFIDPYLDSQDGDARNLPSGIRKPFVTLTYAQSLDSKLSLAPGTQTVLSGSETKAMTHYLRSKHDAILVGVGTALADDPALNCRLEGVDLEHQPRPVILDPQARWHPGQWPEKLSTCMRLARERLGKGPWVLISKERNQVPADKVKCAEECSGKYIGVAERDGEMDWEGILEELGARKIKSVMIEGGAKVINTLLQKKNLHLIDAIIITIAPVWLGDKGVNVSPPPTYDTQGTPTTAARLSNVEWQQFGQDIVMCGHIQR